MRRELHKKVISGREELWDEYCRLRKEVKELVREKKLNIWREVVEKASTDFDGNKKEFWAFVGRRTKGKRKKNIPSLKSEAGVSVTSTRGKLEVIQRHYQQLGNRPYSEFILQITHTSFGGMVAKLAREHFAAVLQINTQLTSFLTFHLKF